MVETMPAFIAVVLAAAYFSKDDPSIGAIVGQWAMIFFIARIVHALVYMMGIPYLRTPVYLVSWLAVLVIGAQTIL